MFVPLGDMWLANKFSTHLNLKILMTRTKYKVLKINFRNTVDRKNIMYIIYLFFTINQLP